MSKQKNISKKVPIGSTLQTRDEYLASGKGRKNIKPDHPNQKDLYRRVGVVDSNQNNELAIIKLGTKGRHKLEKYLSGKSTYNAFIEITDNEGRKIKIDGAKFIRNPSYKDLSKKEVNDMKKKALTDKQTSKNLRRENKNALRELKGRNKKRT